MLLRNLSSLTGRSLAKDVLPSATFCRIKNTLENLFKREPTIVLRDAIQAQKAIVEGYDAGLNNFISKVYLATGFGILASTLGTALGLSIPYFAMNPFRSIGYGFIGTVAGLSGAYVMRPATVTEQQNGVTKLYTQNTLFRFGLFSLGWISNGIMWMPLVKIMSAMFPLILPSFAMLGAGCFGGAALAVKLLPKHYLARYSGLLGGFAGGFVGLGLLSAVKSLFGQVYYQGGITMGDTSAGLGLFLLLIFYNTRQAVKSYRSGAADHLATSISFLYNILQTIRRGLWYLMKK